MLHLFKSPGISWVRVLNFSLKFKKKVGDFMFFLKANCCKCNTGYCRYDYIGNEPRCLICGTSLRGQWTILDFKKSIEKK